MLHSTNLKPATNNKSHMPKLSQTKTSANTDKKVEATRTSQATDLGSTSAVASLATALDTLTLPNVLNPLKGYDAVIASGDHSSILCDAVTALTKLYKVHTRLERLFKTTLDQPDPGPAFRKSHYKAVEEFSTCGRQLCDRLRELEASRDGSSDPRMRSFLHTAGAIQYNARVLIEERYRNIFAIKQGDSHRGEESFYACHCCGNKADRGVFSGVPFAKLDGKGQTSSEETVFMLMSKDKNGKEQEFGLAHINCMFPILVRDHSWEEFGSPVIERIDHLVRGSVTRTTSSRPTCESDRLTFSVGNRKVTCRQEKEHLAAVSDKTLWDPYQIMAEWDRILEEEERRRAVAEKSDVYVR